MKKYAYIFSLVLATIFLSCSPKFDNERAEELLLKSQISENEYDELLKLYETGMDDSLEIAMNGNSDISKKEREEIITMFAIAKRLMADQDKLTPEQAREFERITNKGTEGLEK